MNRILKYIIGASLITIIVVWIALSLMSMSIDRYTAPDKPVYRSSDGQEFTVVHIVALKDVNESITIVDVDTFKDNYYKVP